MSHNAYAKLIHSCTANMHTELPVLLVSEKGWSLCQLCRFLKYEVEFPALTSCFHFTGKHTAIVKYTNPKENPLSHTLKTLTIYTLAFWGGTSCTPDTIHRCGVRLGCGSVWVTLCATNYPVWWKKLSLFFTLVTK